MNCAVSADAPLFYTEGAPNAFLEMMPAYTEGPDRMQVGDEIIVTTWFQVSRTEDRHAVAANIGGACRDCGFFTLSVMESMNLSNIGCRSPFSSILTSMRKSGRSGWMER